jgi:hypothetical protein
MTLPPEAVSTLERMLVGGDINPETDVGALIIYECNPGQITILSNLETTAVMGLILRAIIAFDPSKARPYTQETRQ